MPGLSVLSGSYRDHLDSTDGLLDSICFVDDYGIEREIDTPRTFVAATGYASYPVERYETDEAVVLLEGYLYDGSIRPDRLTTLIAERRYEDLEEWLLEQEGDFLVAVYWKGDESITLLNDAFGRLPTYYATIEETTVVSRELKLLREFARQIGTPLGIDQIAIAQQLVFEHLLGTRTVFEGVRSIPPGSLLHVDGTDVHVERLYQFDFSGTKHADRSIEENARHLASRFTTACERRRVDGTTTVVSLSGGLDSRAVAGGYYAAGTPFTTVTFDTARESYAEEIEIASSIADTLGVEWNLYRTDETDAHRSQLLDTKQGMNTVAMAFILDFFEQLREDYDAVTYATGDGGHRVLVDESPPRRPESVEELVDVLLTTNGRIPLAEAADVAGIDEQRLRRSIRARLESYPESDLSRKYSHFLFRERGLNFLQHGEDRNRYYFWSVSPFYSVDLFRYALNCPAEQKEQRALFAAFLRELAPELPEFEYANFGTSITSIEYRLKQNVLDVLTRHRRIKDLVARILKDEAEVNADIAARIESVLSEPADFGPLSESKMSAIARDHASYRSYGLSVLHTVALLARDLSTTEEPHTGEPMVQ